MEFIENVYQWKTIYTDRLTYEMETGRTRERKKIVCPCPCAFNILKPARRHIFALDGDNNDKRKKN